MNTADSYPEFRPAEAERFASQSPQFRDFLNWEDGVLWELLNSEASYQRMAAFSLSGMPAVASLTHHLSVILEPVDELGETDPSAASLADRARRAIGSMIRVVMETNGFRKTGLLKGVAPDPRRLFVRASVYELIPIGEGAEPEPFNWDRYVHRASFINVLSLSPWIGSRAVPSMYGPDRRWFYLSSEDVDVPVNDEEQLRIRLAQIKARFEILLKDSPRNFVKLGVYQTDFYEICRMLDGIVNDPDEFSDPEHLLFSELEKKGQ